MKVNDPLDKVSDYVVSLKNKLTEDDTLNSNTNKTI